LNTFRISVDGPPLDGYVLNVFNMEAPMDPTFATYLVYLAVSIVLTVWVARTLSKHGLTFLRDVFGGNAALASSVNHLLVVGFYLVNLGFISFNLRLGLRVYGSAEATEALSQKVGLVLLVLGGLHFFNLWILHRMRNRALLSDAPPPVAPDGQIAFAARPGTEP
jgi:hypothetical protein